MIRQYGSRHGRAPGQNSRLHPKTAQGQDDFRCAGAHDSDVSLYADGDGDAKDDRWREDLEFTIPKVTYQMNNAFAALRGKAELGMRKAPVNEEVKKFSDILGILDSVETLNKELMSFGKALTRRPFKSMDVMELIRHRTLAHAHMFHAAGAQLCVQIAPRRLFSFPPARSRCFISWTIS
jgi:hypothetical protein